MRLLTNPPIPLDTHLYIIRDTGKVRVRSDLNRESLALLDGEFVIELGAVGYSSVPGPENGIARGLTGALSEHSRMQVFGPQALERLRVEIADSRAAIGVDRAAQIAIRDSLGVDYIVSGAFARH